MKINDMPIGSSLTLGSVDSNSIVWVKVSEANDFMASDSVASRCFDRQEYRSPTRGRRSGGNNFYPHSNIHSWLNGSGSDWAKPTHQYDEVTSYGDNGFLTEWQPWELDLLQPRHIRVSVPKGSLKEFGRVYEFDARVVLPSIDELGDYDIDDHIKEAYFLPEACQIASRVYYVMTRTAIHDACRVVAFTNGVGVRTAQESARVVPMIRLSPEAEVVDTTGSGFFDVVHERTEAEIAEANNLMSLIWPA